MTLSSFSTGCATFFALVLTTHAIPTPVVHSAQSLADVCTEELVKLCETDRHNLTSCRSCIEENHESLQRAQCTAAEELDFCHPTPQPTEKCLAVLDRDCGSQRLNTTYCFHCVTEHEKDIREANCSAPEIEHFCQAPAPPHNASCALALEHDCGGDRANRTKCFECVREHAPSLEHDGCEPREIEAFCGGNDTRTCYEELEADCGADRHSTPLCHTCVEAHRSQLEKAGCDAQEAERFCEGPGPGPAPGEDCERVMFENCGRDRENRTLCGKCLAAHVNATHAAHCTVQQLEQFCHPVTPPGEECRRVLESDCGDFRENRTACHICVKTHEPEFENANCSAAQVTDFCEAPHPPPVPGRCEPELVKLCNQQRKNRTTCIHCVEEHAQILHEYNCTYEEYDRFCEVPAPNSTCPAILERECGADRHNITLCTPEELAHFCSVRPPSPPTPDECTKVLTEYCEVDRHNHTLCVLCAEHHHNDTTRAHCTYEDIERVCAAPPNPPTPGDQCKTVLDSLCHFSIGQSACLECEKEHVKVLEQAHCTAAEMIAYCKQQTPAAHMLGFLYY